MPKLTIAIATLNDHEGLWWTLQILSEFHDVSQCQLLVVDQDPDSEQGRASASLVVKKLKRRDGLWDSVKYVPFRNPKGIGPARNKLFQEADGDFVLCLDSHVVLPTGVLGRLIEYVDANPESRDLWVGPLLSDGGGFVGTHQALQWRAEAWGTWARDKDLFEPDAEPKEVPTQGLGLFCCRKDAFPGFHPAQQGFGCAEAVFAEKFRRRGDKVFCLPFLRWLHRFFRFGGPPYPVYKIDKVSNYLIEMLSEGIDPSEMLNHFEGQLNDSEMAELQTRLEAAIPNPQTKAWHR
jgi:glycosyltransferase involved in cell wall biosynthesis